ncbi:hypothetical protein GALL_551490 [mine drainage metagenome]|uniref:Uncharacterized protein n=1 Tax=mine drainage metagenome TaxID=410659 RepID=A0A1J5PIC2_9ZZZZ
MRLQQAAQPRQQRRQLVRLDAEHDEILGAEGLGGVARRHARDQALVRVEQRETVAPDRVQVRAARHHRDLVPGRGQLHRQRAADRAGSDDQGLHARPLSAWRVAFAERGRDHAPRW